MIHFDSYTRSVHNSASLFHFSVSSTNRSLIVPLIPRLLRTLFHPTQLQFIGRRLAVKSRKKRKRVFPYDFLLFYCRVFWTFLFGCYSDKLALAKRKKLLQLQQRWLLCSSCVNRRETNVDVLAGKRSSFLSISHYRVVLACASHTWSKQGENNWSCH